MLTYSFLYVPKYPLSLLGRDILHKLGATICLMGNRLEIAVPLDKEHEIIMFMDEEKPPCIEKVTFPGVKPRSGLGGTSCRS